ncbi:hypothetical protein Tco_1207426, partial [Tanacetum coccineum]
DNGNGGNGNGENGNGRNGNPNENGRGDRPVARECTYQDFMKCQPLNFNGTEGVVRLIRWFEKMETIFHISNYCIDAVRIANNLMDQKLKGYDAKNAENKRRLEVNQRDNRGQHPSFKRPNVGGQTVARAYTAGNNEKKLYNGPLPLCNKIVRQGHFRSGCLKLKDQNRRNKDGNKNGVGEARGKAYVLGGGEANLDSNVVKAMRSN